MLSFGNSGNNYLEACNENYTCLLLYACFQELGCISIYKINNESANK